MSEAGGNDPFPCGSGRTFTGRCLVREPPAVAARSAWAAGSLTAGNPRSAASSGGTRKRTDTRVFSWDVPKAQTNREKHGMAFEEAATVPVDPDGLDRDDPDHSREERGCKRPGRSMKGRVLLVVHATRRPPHGKDGIGIISPRQASRKARKAHAGSQG